MQQQHTATARRRRPNQSEIRRPRRARVVTGWDGNTACICTTGDRFPCAAGIEADYRRAGQTRQYRTLDQSLGIHHAIVTRFAQASPQCQRARPDQRTRQPAPPLAKTHRQHLPRGRMQARHILQRRVDQPVDLDLRTCSGKIREGRKGVHHVTERGQLDQQHAHSERRQQGFEFRLHAFG